MENWNQKGCRINNLWMTTRREAQIKFKRLNKVLRSSKTKIEIPMLRAGGGWSYALFSEITSISGNN